MEAGEEFARETGEITWRRFAIGLSLYFLFAAVGAAVEWRMYPERGPALLAAHAVQVAIALVCGLVLYRQRWHPRAAQLSLAGAAGICMTVGAYNAVVGGNLVYVLMTFLAFILVCAMFLPWGAFYQTGMNGAVLLSYAVALSGAERSSSVIAYDLLFLTAAGALAVLGALYFDRHRRNLFARAAELREANRRIEEASRARTELLSGLAHDMRTPLGVLLGYAQMLGESEVLDAGLRAPVRSIQREARELLQLVDAVLALARLESGQLPLQVSEFRLADALRPLRETAEDLLQSRPIALHWTVPEDLVVRTDAEKVREIARNLLSNAIKFTQSGEIRFEAQRASGGFSIRVSDTGAGIAPERLDWIFERFQRFGADCAEDRQLAGLGFGLYLVRWLVRFLGGSIAVQSRPGAGSRFEVWLPGEPPA